LAGIVSKQFRVNAERIKKQLGIEMVVTFARHDAYFPGDIHHRDVFSITLRHGEKGFTFEFGQSISSSTGDGGKPPTFYDIMTGLQKYDPGTFENFCSKFGYDEDSRAGEKVYKGVKKGYKNMAKMFTSEELELLSEIQ